MSEDRHSPFIGIASTVGGISVAIIAILAVLAKDQLFVGAWVVAALAVMGMYLGKVAGSNKER